MKTIRSLFATLAFGILLLANYQLNAQDFASQTIQVPLGTGLGYGLPDLSQLTNSDILGIVSASSLKSLDYQPNFLGAEVPLDSHRASGFIIGALFSGAAVIGWIHYSNVVNGITDDAALKYVHIGLVGTGELFYLYNAITGISMIPKGGHDSTIGTLHRSAFFVHITLMAAQLVMGLFLSNAIDHGDTATVQSLGLAHAIVGTAIPVIELTSGVFTYFPGIFGD